MGEHARVSVPLMQVVDCCMQGADRSVQCVGLAHVVRARAVYYREEVRLWFDVERKLE